MYLCLYLCLYLYLAQTLSLPQNKVGNGLEGESEVSSKTLGAGDWGLGQSVQDWLQLSSAPSGKLPLRDKNFGGTL